MTNHFRPRSINDFCDRHGICRATFYNHRHRMPKVTKVGSRSLILEEHERAWAARQHDNENEKADPAA